MKRAALILGFGLLGLAGSWSAGIHRARAAPTAAAVPRNHIPESVLGELRALDKQFEAALAHDCAPERCVAKGCSYRDHAVVDMPNATSLPGIEQSEGPGSVPSQEYLTHADCDFAHEKSVSARDVQALTKRLEQRLSKGWRKVAVGHQVLEPISPALSESPAEKPAALPEALPEVDPSQPPVKWEGNVAARELWLGLLPHFSWMIAVFLGTLALLVLIWAARRLGRESIEEKALLAQMTAGTNGAVAAKDPQGEPEPGSSNDATRASDGVQDVAFVTAQRQLWAGRIADAELENDKNVVAEVMRQWLKAKEFPLLAKAIFTFGDRLPQAFSSDGELVVRKVEFAEYLRHLDDKQLPSDGTFFRKLNQHAVSSALLAQPDAALYNSVGEDFGSAGVTQLIGSLQPRHGAFLFALMPTDRQQDVAGIMPPELRQRIAAHLLSSNRISKDERRYVFEVLEAAQVGRPLPSPPKPEAHGLLDVGREIDAAEALSVLLSHLDRNSRHALFKDALERSGGAIPLWYQDILYPDMLLNLPQEIEADMLLEVDVQGLAGWSSIQHPAWQAAFINRMPPAMQNAIRANMTFASRGDQMRLARRGRSELVSAVKRLLAGGKISFPQIVA